MSWMVEHTENNAGKPSVIELKDGNFEERVVGQRKGGGDIFEGGVAEDSGGKGFGGDAKAKLFFDSRDDEIARQIGGEDDLGGDKDQDDEGDDQSGNPEEDSAQ